MGFNSCCGSLSLHIFHLNQSKLTVELSMKLIKAKNLKAYEGQMVECQYVHQAPEQPKPGPPFGGFAPIWYPR